MSKIQCENAVFLHWKRVHIIKTNKQTLQQEPKQKQQG